METVASKTTERTKSQKIEEAMENARQLESLNKAVTRLEGFLSEIAIGKIDVYKQPSNVKMGFYDEEAASLLTSGIRARIAELNRDIDAIVARLP